MKHIIIGFIAGAILLAGTSMVFADAIKLPNGTPFEALQATIDELWAAIANVETTPGPQGPQGEPGPQGAPGSTLHLFDANGQDLGLLLYNGEYLGRKYQTYVAGIASTLNFEQNSSGRVVNMGPGAGPINYLEDNCQGDPYSTMQGNPPGVIVNQDRVFRFVDGSTRRGVRFVSILHPNLGCIPDTNTQDLYPLEEVTSSIPFDPSNLGWPLEIREL